VAITDEGPVVLTARSNEQELVAALRETARVRS
jgi:hypothetical protein